MVWGGGLLARTHCTRDSSARCFLVGHLDEDLEECYALNIVVLAEDCWTLVRSWLASSHSNGEKSPDVACWMLSQHCIGHLHDGFSSIGYLASINERIFAIEVVHKSG